MYAKTEAQEEVRDCRRIRQLNKIFARLRKLDLEDPIRKAKP